VAAAPVEGQLVPLLCPECQYDLRATTTGQCPECGDAFDPAKLREITLPWRVRSTPISLVTTVLLVLFKPSRLVRELAAPVDERRARKFRNGVVLPLAVLVGVGAAAVVYGVFGQGKLLATSLLAEAGQINSLTLPVVAAVDWPAIVILPVFVMVVLLARMSLAGMVVAGAGASRDTAASLSRYAAAGLIPLVLGVAGGVGGAWLLTSGHGRINLAEFQKSAAWHIAVTATLGVALSLPLLAGKRERKVRRIALWVLGLFSVLLVLVGVVVPGALPWLSPVDRRGTEFSMGQMASFVLGGAVVLWGLAVLTLLPMGLLRRTGVPWWRVGVGVALSGVAGALAVVTSAGLLWLAGLVRLMFESLAL